jgi:uncharacterized protein (TIGR02145 family)
MYSSINHHLALTILLVTVILGSCKKEKIPAVSTMLVTDITETAATSGGDITDPGSSIVISSGVCWSSGSNPTVADNITTDGNSDGSFQSYISGLISGKNYFVRAYAENSAGVGYGSVLQFTTQDKNLLAITEPVSNINDNSVRLNGIVSKNALPTTMSFEYGPTTSYGGRISLGQNSNSISETQQVRADLTNLLSGSTYHYRAVAENSSGTSYGNDVKFTTSLTDIDGNRYSTVIIGDQVWMHENLKTTKYGNGDLILTTVIQGLDITYQTAPKYQWPSDFAVNGRFYTYYAITDSRNLCPVGWHVPTDEEWITLTDYLSNNGYGYSGNSNFIAKAMAATSGWVADTTAGNVGNDQLKNNSSGFSGLSSGGRYSNGVVHFVGLHGIWWSSTESLSTEAYFRCIGYLPGRVFKGVFPKSYGLPVRCLRNN